MNCDLRVVPIRIKRKKRIFFLGSPFTKKKRGGNEGKVGWGKRNNRLKKNNLFDVLYRHGQQSHLPGTEKTG